MMYWLSALEKLTFSKEALKRGLLVTPTNLYSGAGLKGDVYGLKVNSGVIIQKSRSF